MKNPLEWVVEELATEKGETEEKAMRNDSKRVRPTT